MRASSRNFDPLDSHKDCVRRQRGIADITNVGITDYGASSYRAHLGARDIAGMRGLIRTPSYRNSYRSAL